MSRYSDLSNQELIRLLRRRGKFAFVELGRRYSQDVAIRIRRINSKRPLSPTWLTRRILNRATVRTLEIVVGTVTKSDRDDIDLDALVFKSAKYMGFLLRRSASAEDAGESVDD